jgi:hypothetical protein
MARHKRSYSGERCTVKRTVQLTPTHAAQLDAAAAAAGAPFGTFARELLVRRAATVGVVAGTRRNPDASQLADQVRPLGINMNQIARHLNSTGELRDWRELTELLAEIKAVFARILAL